jgi:DNA transformation protein and related proteins
MARSITKSAVLAPNTVSPADEFAAYCAELLRPLGVCKIRKMFGGHGISLDGLSIALVAWEQLWLKVDEQTKPKFQEAGCRPFVYDGKGKPIEMSYWTPPADTMESCALMLPWARLAHDAALRAAAKKNAKAPAKKTTVKPTSKTTQSKSPKAAKSTAKKPLKRKAK